MKSQALLLGMLLSAFVVSGCSRNTKRDQPPALTYDQLMQQADTNLRTQNVDGARLFYTKAAAADPTRKEPWFRLAQLDFNQQNYGGAILSAQEVLQRDAADVDAESILTVAGLRVAVDALGRLHDEDNLQGPAHQEAEKLAEKLRETLGEEVLVPKKAVRTPPKRRIARAPVTPAAAPAAGADKPASEAAPAAPVSNDPFSGLPGR
ncbi:hypothetical protein ASG87_02825 [Frateuria sp. Soil773]|uniref:hypothetical protein n=1 Tax=Frateuria sp. Soil773 TaxID=1736407 RepID=UPI0006FD4370|nr:hypothetical protein [Frateuria sp. Soil773]KRE89294.1 hypothetical protein ASG87_02825 [Frateuria sp. Soil773]